MGEKKITDVQIQKNNKNRVNVYVEGEYLFACSTEIVFTYHIEKGKSIDLEEIKSIIENDNFIKCKDTALRIIEKNYKTEKEIKEKLVLKGYDELNIEKVIDFLKEYAFVDDYKYAEAYIKEKSRAQGSRKIYYALVAKGIKEDIIKEKLGTNPGNEKEAAIILCEKKYNTLMKSSNPIDNKKLYKKLCDFLLSKGFGYEIIKDVVNLKLKEE